MITEFLILLVLFIIFSGGSFVIMIKTDNFILSRIFMCGAMITGALITALLAFVIISYLKVL